MIVGIEVGRKTPGREKGRALLEALDGQLSCWQQQGRCSGHRVVALAVILDCLLSDKNPEKKELSNKITNWSVLNN